MTQKMQISFLKILPENALKFVSKKMRICVKNFAQLQDYTVPTTTLIEKVQKEIDSVAPIGHIVTVDGTTQKEIQIETNIVYQTGWSWKTSGNYIEKAIDAYFQELAKNWASSDQLIVRISQIETRILDCAGVIDISNTKINGNAENLILESNFIPVRGSVTDGA
ncbi:MAG: baseplate J/gp47 family protein [Roseburia inulinivorans]